MYELLGCVIIYATIHFFILQKKNWDNLTTWEKVVTIFATISITLTYMDVMFG
jgi:hypothetical protein